MSLHLLQIIQEKWGTATSIKKVDPNTQEIKSNDNGDWEEQDRLNQAAIPAVLIAMYKYSRSNEAAEEILNGHIHDNWLNEILGNIDKKAAEKVADYAGVSEEEAETRMELVAREAVHAIRQNNPKTVNDVQNILAAQRNDILTHLPAVLQMGDLLKDDTIDDRTNKMEGPVSTFMNFLGSAFSGAENEKEKSL